jgi:hypothetical protein
MNFNRVSAGAGWAWFTQSLLLVKRLPLVFPVMGLIIAVIQLIPFVGGLIGVILGPALIGGTIAAAHAADNGNKPSPGQLFQAFQHSDRVGPMVALCIPIVVAILVAGVLLAIFMIGAAISGGLSASEAALRDPQMLASTLGGSTLLLLPLLILVLLVGYAFTFYAIPRTMLDGVEAFASMKQSFAACRANVGAFLVAVVVLLPGSWLILLVLKFLHLGWLTDTLTTAALYTVLGPVLYFGYKVVFGNATPQTAASPAPTITPNEPPAAPPPTAVE